MKIDVNKDLGSYKQDFFKGLNIKETTCAAVAIVIVTGCTFGLSMLHVPMIVSMWIGIILGGGIVAYGFLKVEREALPEYLKRLRKTQKAEIIVFQSTPEGFFDEEPEEEQNDNTGTESYLGEKLITALNNRRIKKLKNQGKKRGRT